MEAVNGAMAETLKGVASSCLENPQAHRSCIQTRPMAAKAKPHPSNPAADDVEDGPECKRRQEGHPEAREGVDGQRQAPLSAPGIRQRVLP